MKKVFFLLTSLLILITMSCSSDDEILTEQEVNAEIQTDQDCIPSPGKKDCDDD